MQALLHEVIRCLHLPESHERTASIHGRKVERSISHEKVFRRLVRKSPRDLAVITGEDDLIPISNRSNTEV